MISGANGAYHEDWRPIHISSSVGIQLRIYNVYMLDDHGIYTYIYIIAGVVRNWFDDV
jgi:hypothetical protein